LDAIEEKRQLHWFLTYRCSKDFLAGYIAQMPTLFEKLRHWGAYLNAYSEVRLIGRLHECGLLPEAERKAFVEGVYEILRFTLDDGFLTMESIKAMFAPEELAKALELVEDFLINRLDDEIYETANNFSPKDSGSPESHFDALSSSLKIFSEELVNSPISKQAIERGFNRIRDTIHELEEEHPSPDEDYEGYGGSGRLSDLSDGRSTFDDVDE
jgi:hypothetical protein